jgi:hypothetical protein
MRKFIVLLSLLFTTLFAQQDAEQFHFVGLTVSTDSMDFESISNLSSQDETAFGIRYGRQTLDWRTVFTLSGNGDLQTFALEVDKILVDALFGMPEIRPYLGASVGYLHYEEDDGYYYGGNFGFLLYTTDTIDVDLAYHYYKVEKLEPMDTMQGANLSIHYFY